jgi:ribosomal protein S18 acetylase RimI-like enzyme
LAARARDRSAQFTNVREPPVTGHDGSLHFTNVRVGRASKLVMRVRFPSPALRDSLVRSLTASKRAFECRPIRAHPASIPRTVQTPTAQADDGVAAAVAAVELTSVYLAAGVGAWALWMPSRARDLDAPDAVREIDGMKHDTTTLVMQAAMPSGLQRHDEVVGVSLAALMRIANDELVPAADLGKPEAAPGLSVWAMVQDGMAVGCAYGFVHGSDCGVYAVGTLPPWRRRGLARALTEHVLAEAGRHGARTATLQSTQMGQHLYEAFGFQPAGRSEEWVPQ